MGVNIVPGHSNPFSRVFRQQHSEKLSYLYTLFVFAKNNQVLSRMIVHSTNPIVFRWFPGSADHDLLPFGTPHTPQGRLPTHVKLVSIKEQILDSYFFPGLFDRFFLTS